MLSSQPQGVFVVGAQGDESWAAASNSSRWLCQEPGAPPGWGCPLTPCRVFPSPGKGICEAGETLKLSSALQPPAVGGIHWGGDPVRWRRQMWTRC